MDGIQSSIVNLAQAKSQTGIMANVSTKLLSKTMDVQEGMASGLIQSMENASAKAQAFAGDNGFLFDAQA